jgi:hypothetical protein
MEKLFDETKSGMGRAEYIEVEPNVPPPAAASLPACGPLTGNEPC